MFFLQNFAKSLKVPGRLYLKGFMTDLLESFVSNIRKCILLYTLFFTSTKLVIQYEILKRLTFRH